MRISHHRALEALTPGEWFSARELSDKTGETIGVRGLRTLTKRGYSKCAHVHKGAGPHRPAERFKITPRGIAERDHIRKSLASVKKAEPVEATEPASLLPPRSSAQPAGSSSAQPINPPMQQGLW